MGNRCSNDDEILDFVKEEEKDNDSDSDPKDDELDTDIMDKQKYANEGGDIDVEEVSETIFENVQSQSHKMDDCNIRQNETQSKDPFKIYDLLNKKKHNINGDTSSNVSMKYPPGFTPTGDDKTTFEVKNTSHSGKSMEDKEQSMCSGLAQKDKKEWVKELSTTNKDYLNMVIGNWNGEVIIMGDFNEVRIQAERYGSMFNIQGANALNSFISGAGLEEVPLVVALDRYLSYHRPILMCESLFDYGPIPFRFFHYWFDMEGFNTFVEKTWKETNISDHNAMTRFLKKLKYTKEKIREWIKVKKDCSNNYKKTLEADIVKIDILLDKWESNSDILNKRFIVSKALQDIDKLESMEVAQKAKIKWAIEGDENSKYYHCILNKKRSQLAIRSILVDGFEFPNKLNLEQQMDLETNVTHEEIKRAVWDCEVDKSPGPDGFTFGFYRRYWSLLEKDMEDVFYFFSIMGLSPKGFNTFVEKTWKETNISDHNAMTRFLKKLKYTKEKIREWIKVKKDCSNNYKKTLEADIVKIDILLDKWESNSDILNKRFIVSKALQDIDKLESMEVAQKAKIKWAIEGDENSKYYHCILNKKRSQLAIRSILVDGFEFPNKLNLEQQMDLETNVTHEEIKRAVWDCEVDKSPGPDGFTFGFYRRYWSLLEKDMEDVFYFFSIMGLSPKLVGVLGDIINKVQSAFSANMKILDGPFILNELFQWYKKKKKQTLIFKVDFKKAYDSVRWDYLDDVLKNFGFGDTWRGVSVPQRSQAGRPALSMFVYIYYGKAPHYSSKSGGCWPMK
nr:RNA-directed DNA polymerase, eukaryota, reverse transcriptase zinc-binding domain protein [Tanacetum cinerariifolium]